MLNIFVIRYRIFSFCIICMVSVRVSAPCRVTDRIKPFTELYMHSWCFSLFHFPILKQHEAVSPGNKMPKPCLSIVILSVVVIKRILAFYILALHPYFLFGCIKTAFRTCRCFRQGNNGIWKSEVLLDFQTNRLVKWFFPFVGGRRYITARRKCISLFNSILPIWSLHPQCQAEVPLC